MPILRLKDIRDMSGEDRRKRLTELRTELVRLRTMIKAGGAVENPGRVHELRKTIARVVTVESELRSAKETLTKGKKKESNKV